MTQAFNLAQFANFLNSSGQVSSSGLQSGIATQWTTSGSDIYFVNKVSIGASTTPVGTLDVTRSVSDSAIEEIMRIRRTGGNALYGNSREGAITFYDENNGSLIGAISGVRQSPPSDYNGGMALYVNNTGGSSNNSVANLTKAFAINSSSVMSFNSGYGSVAPAYGCRAWVNFNGTGTVAIRASGNVSSITDNGTGNYTLNFSVSMPDVNYAICATAGGSTTFGSQNLIYTPDYYATGSCRVYTTDDNNPITAQDSTYINVAIFR